MTGPLAAPFLASWTGAPAAVPELESVLVDIVAKARVAFPGIAIANEVFVRHLAVRADPAKPILEALGSLRADDLFLACGGAAGDRQALFHFEATCLRAADASLAKRGMSSDVAEEAKQIIRERMLVGDGAPRLLDYDGRGDIRQWTRIALIREAIYLSKKEKRDSPLSDALLMIAGTDDNPEVAYFKKRYRAEYKEAFEAALGQLSSRERALLRQQYILGLNVDAIGTIYQVHRATAARWVQSAREELFSKARRELGDRLGLSRPEIENIVKMIESQLEVSLHRLLAESERR